MTKPFVRAISSLVVVLVCFSFGARHAAADIITFDRDGGAGPTTPSTLSSFQLGPGNLLYDNLLPSTGPLIVGTTFQAYFQTALTGFLDSGGNPVPLAPGTELTLIASATLVVTSVSPTLLTVALATTQVATSYLEMWFDTTPDANALTGTGFNDGTRILLSTPADSSFDAGQQVLSSPPTIVQFDLFGANNYPGINAAFSAGGLQFGGDVITFDPSFFLTAPLDFTIVLGTTLSQFTQTDPSMLFASLPGGAPPTLVPTIGTVNLGNGPDAQFNSLAGGSAAFTTAQEEAPEPGTLALLGLGFGIWGSRRYRSDRGSARH